MMKKNIRCALIFLVFQLTSLLFTNNCFSKDFEARDENYPLLAMELIFVDELIACNLPKGYSSQINGVKCPVLEYEKIPNASRQPEEIMKTKPSPPSPPDQPISLSSSQFSKKLEDYRKYMRNNQKLSPDERSSVVMVFDFGEPSSRRNAELEVLVKFKQSGTGCNGQSIVENKETSILTVPPGERFRLTHKAADLFIPCSSVTWTITAVNNATRQKYAPWSFKTTP